MQDRPEITALPEFSFQHKSLALGSNRTKLSPKNVEAIRQTARTAMERHITSQSIFAPSFWLRLVAQDQAPPVPMLDRQR